MKRIHAIILMSLSSLYYFAQSEVVSGKVTDNTGSPVPYASVVMIRDGAIITGRND